MGPVRLIFLSSLLVFSESALAQRWAQFTGEDGDFRIMAPGGMFDIETVDFETEYGIVELGNSLLVERHRVGVVHDRQREHPFIVLAPVNPRGSVAIFVEELERRLEHTARR